MKKFILIQRGDKLGYISSNLRTSTWGIVQAKDRDSLIQSLQEEYGSNIAISFPRAPSDDLLPREQIAFLKLSNYLNNEIIKEKLMLKDLIKKNGGR